MAIEKQTANIAELIARVKDTPDRNAQTLLSVETKFDVALNHAAWAIMWNKVRVFDHILSDVKALHHIYRDLHEMYMGQELPDVLYVGLTKSGDLNGNYIFLKKDGLLIKPIARKPQDITNFTVYSRPSAFAEVTHRRDIQPYQVLPV